VPTTLNKGHYIFEKDLLHFLLSEHAIAFLNGLIKRFIITRLVCYLGGLMERSVCFIPSNEKGDSPLKDLLRD